ncbi:MAG: penicillin-binding protein 2 [Candidatus Zixiibacteriota bacterium]
MIDLVTKSVRFKIVAAVMAVIFLFLIAKLIQLQVISYDYYFQMSEENRIRLVPRTAMRGKIVDREGRTLATDRPAYTVSVIPSEINQLARLSEELSPLLAMEKGTIEQKVRERRSRKYEPIPIRRDIDFASVCIIEESNELFPGVMYQLDHARTYPNGNVAAHIIGYTGEVDERESKMQYRVGSMIGRAGVEKQYDQALRGLDGIDYQEVTATGRILGALESKPNKDPMPGSELGLSLDLDLQVLCDSLFGDSLSGAAIFIDPRNGEVLAMISKPNYDANLFSGFVPRDAYQQLSSDERRPLLDRVIRGTYPPGSTAKLLTAGAALELGIIEPNSHFKACYGGYQFGNRYFRCHKKSGHGTQDVIGAIEVSCDTYFYQVGLKLGLQNYSDFAKKCGFDMLTGIDIPAERAGNVPTEEWYNKAYGKYGWTKAVLLNLGIGQGEILTTPIGLAAFYCGIANGGKVMKPHLMRYIKSVDGEISQSSPEVLRQLPFSASTLAILLEGCRRVVEGGSGTAARSRIPGIEMGGKTGTAQNPHGNEHAWFCGFAPFHNPTIVGCVIVENAGHGSTVSAPIVKEVFIRHFQKTGLLAPPPPPLIEDIVQL